MCHIYATKQNYKHNDRFVFHCLTKQVVPSHICIGGLADIVHPSLATQTNWLQLPFVLKEVIENHLKDICIGHFM